MQAVILAAGQSSRFYPFNASHKSLVTVLGKPIIVHTLESIRKSGVKDVVIVTDPNNFFKPVLDAESLDLNIEYVVLHKPSGMGDALLQAAPFINSDFYLLHPHHVEFDLLKKEMEGKEEPEKALILIQEKDSVSGFGVVETAGDRVLSITEKPEQGKEASKLRIIGVYRLPKSFLPVLKETEPEHYSFEKALDTFAKKGSVKAVKTDSISITLKYPWDLLSLKDFLLEKINTYISKKAKVSKGAKIEGRVIIEEGAEVSENAVIKGPAYIGQGVFVGTNALIRGNTSLEDGVKIGAFTEVKNSLVFSKTTVHSGFIGDSVIGAMCKMGSLFNTANVRLDREGVKVVVGDEKINTGLRSLGVIMGNGVIVGGNVSVMPGIIVGNNVNIGPSTTVMKNVPSDSVFYTKFQEIVEKNKK